MDLTKLTDQEKSVMLARAMGWSVRHDAHNPDLSHVCNERGLKEYSQYYNRVGHNPWSIMTNLYDPANMALAWRVLNWAFDVSPYFLPPYWYRDHWEEYPGLAPADAQRAWLDKILALAIEAGIVELTHELG